MIEQKTTFAKKGSAPRGWVLVDLADKVLGRAATRIADILRGKNKPIYTPHTDTGDFVIAVNASRVRLTGKKLTDKIYYRHTGYVGGLKAVPAGRMKDPTEIIRRAVHGMLPKNRTNKHLMKKLHIYAGPEHPHQAQQPRTIEVS